MKTKETKANWSELIKAGVYWNDDVWSWGFYAEFRDGRSVSGEVKGLSREASDDELEERVVQIAQHYGTAISCCDVDIENAEARWVK